MLRRTRLAVLGLALAQNVFACKCAQPSGLCDQLRVPRLSGLVFVGTVTDLGPIAHLLEKMKANLTPTELARVENHEEELSIEEKKELLGRVLPIAVRRLVQAARTEDEIEKLFAAHFPFLKEENQPVQLFVNETLSGDPMPKQEIWTSVSSCGIPFELGHRYVVFAGLDEKTGRYETRACGGTFEPDGDNDKRLNHLRAIRQGAIPAELVSVVGTGSKSDSRMDGVTVRLDSASVHFEAKSNARGVVEFAPLIAGRYTLSATAPGLQFPGLPRTIELGAGCTIHDIVAVPATREVAK